MTRTLRTLAFLLLAACGSTRAAETSGPPAARALSEDLIPLGRSRAAYVLSSGATRTMRTEPEGTGAVLWLEGDATGPKRMDVRREGGGFVFSGGPDAETELLRIGARPGDAWGSGAATVHFDGWERIVVPAGSYDAARIRTVTGPATLPVVQTWWFAPGTGLVRLRSDRGGIFGDEMSLAGSPAAD